MKSISFFFYNHKHARTHKFIQQESTFWRRSLWAKAGQHVSTQYKFAGDFELWIRFFQHEKLYHANAVLGSFRQTAGGQASSDHYQEYLQETFDILTTHPLSKKERKQLRYFNILERWVNFLEKYSLILRKKVRTPSIVRNVLYFEKGEQRIKKKG